MTAPNNFDVAVIGSGPGGYVAAIRAAQLNLKTAIIEKEALGGICLNWGCIPSKSLLTNARIFNFFKASKEWGITAQGIHFDMEQIIDNSRKVADSLSKGVSFLMKKNKITVIPGRARFNDQGELTVTSAKGEEQSVRARHIIIATGARARTLPGIEVDEKRILTYKQALVLRQLPESIAIIGAGAIGAEFAYFFNSFGAEVTLVEMQDQLLPQEDVEVARELEKSFRKQGIRTLLKTKVVSAKSTKNGARVVVENEEGEEQTLKASCVLNAVGVVGNIENLGLEAAGIETGKHHIPVDRWYRTNLEGIYAIGDVIGPPWLAHVASHEGIICVEKLAGGTPQSLDYDNIPSCTYCQPQVASVGLTEARAKEKGLKFKVGKFPFQALGKAKAIRATEGFVKLIFDEQYGELLGAHIIGEEATEMIAELVTARTLETTYLELLRTVHAHPTLSEAVMEAAGMAYGEQIHL